MKKMRYLTAALCAVVLLCGFTLPAFASGEEWGDVEITERTPVQSAEPTPDPTPEVTSDPTPDPTPAATPDTEPSPTTQAKPAATPSGTTTTNSGKSTNTSGNTTSSKTTAATLSAEAAEPAATDEAPENGATGGLDWEGLDPATMSPLTPDGTGTVLDNATDSEGKEFFTITTANGEVFYLVIDRQRNGENVYFLNGVTISDLMALAESGAEAPYTVTPVTQEPDTDPAPSVEPEPDPEPESKSSGNMATLILALAVIAVGGGAGWYFKIYRPKQQRVSEVEEDYGGEYDLLEDFDDDEVPAWEDGDAD